jgi:hypothetical protein
MSLTEKPLVLELSTLGKKSSLRKYLSILNENESYRSCFKEGADLMPRQAVIVDILGNKKAKVLSVQMSEVETINGVSISKAELNLNLFLLRSNQM